MRFLYLLILLLFAGACDEETFVKPNARLRLEYPEGTYKRFEKVPPYSFLKSELASSVLKKNNGIELNYKGMNATVFLTYQKVDGNLNDLLRDAQKLAYGHNIKANSIPEQPFANPENNSYGMLYMINGDAASQSQFYITDSLSHFVTGALYFNAKPNFDSIYPAVAYLRNDMRTIMETMEWKGDSLQ